MSANHDLQVAVVGSGYWGKNLVRNYQELGALRLICDQDGGVLAGFAQQYPDIDTCLAFSEVLSREEIGAVAIATPAETHFVLAREALLAGKHVYVEKPLVLEEDQGRELIGLADERERVLMVGHLLQYHPVFVHLQKLVQKGALGRLDYIYSHRLNLGKIRREENILWSFAPHDISMILALAGEPPARVMATGGCYLHQRIADVTTTHLEFDSGLRAHVFVSWLHPFKVQQLVVVGEDKMAVFDDTLPWADKLLLYPHRIDWQNNLPVPVKAEAERPQIPEAEPLRQECLHFLECIGAGRQPATDGAEGLRVLGVLKAAQESLDAGGKGVAMATGAVAGAEMEAAGAVGMAMGAAAGAAGAVAAGAAAAVAGSTYVAHPSAEIDTGVEIGAGTRIWHFSHVLAGSRIGRECTIGQNVMIGPQVEVGARCKIQNNVSVYRGVTLEDGVFCGPSMVFTNVFMPRAEVQKMDQVRPTRVGRGATLGANCTIVCGVTIGAYAFVGAGAVVTRSVPDYALVVGNPSRQIGWMSRYGERLALPVEGEGEAVCPASGERYQLSDGKLTENI